MSSERATLNASPRTEFGSRTTRRLRRDGKVPGVVYSGGDDAVSFQVESRDARVILNEGHALFDLEIEGSKAVPVVVKEQQHHPVRGDLQHLDLQQVDLNQAIQAEVPIELTGDDVSPGVKQGGVLDQPTREITVEALPAASRRRASKRSRRPTWSPIRNWSAKKAKPRAMPQKPSPRTTAAATTPQTGSRHCPSSVAATARAVMTE